MSNLATSNQQIAKKIVCWIESQSIQFNFHIWLFQLQNRVFANRRNAQNKYRYIHKRITFALNRSQYFGTNEWASGKAENKRVNLCIMCVGIYIKPVVFRLDTKAVRHVFVVLASCVNPKCVNTLRSMYAWYETPNQTHFIDFRCYFASFHEHWIVWSLHIHHCVHWHSVL